MAASIRGAGKSAPRSDRDCLDPTTERVSYEHRPRPQTGRPRTAHAQQRSCTQDGCSPSPRRRLEAKGFTLARSQARQQSRDSAVVQTSTSDQLTSGFTVAVSDARASTLASRSKNEIKDRKVHPGLEKIKLLTLIAPEHL